MFQKQRWVHEEPPQQGPTQQKICKCPLQFTPARSSAPAGELGFLTQEKHKCPNILDSMDANNHDAASNQTHIIRTFPNAATSRLDPSSCFVQDSDTSVLILMA